MVLIPDGGGREMRRTGQIQKLKDQILCSADSGGGGGGEGRRKRRRVTE